MQEIHQAGWIKRILYYQGFIDLITTEVHLFYVLTVIFLCNILHIVIARS